MKNTALICICAFIAACASTNVEPAATDETPDIAILENERFLRIDFNGDGLVTPYEHKEYLKANFAKHYDTDGDGRLTIACSKADFTNLIQNFGPRHPAFKECLDVDAATLATYSFDDFFAAHETWWTQADSNSDGFVSRAEYFAVSRG